MKAFIKKPQIIKKLFGKEKGQIVLEENTIHKNKEQCKSIPIT